MTANAIDVRRAGEAITGMFLRILPGLPPVSVAGLVGTVRASHPGLTLSDNELFDLVADEGIRQACNLHFDRANLSGMVSAA